MRRVLLIIASFLMVSGPALALNNGVARTPPMGWDDWNTFACHLDEKLVEQTADAMVRNGMRDAGYRYVVLDDCWVGGRDKNGNLQPNPRRFPHGMKALGDYLHARGLKFGIYETPNTVTCEGRGTDYPGWLGVGSLKHERQDAQTFASWGVDYLKYDHCSGDFRSFVWMRDALLAAGRPIVYSINPEFATNPLRGHLPQIANMSRVADDVSNDWPSIMRVLDVGANFAPLAAPGFFNDFDMLEVGRGMSASEDRAHFGMWAMMASPLIAGNDVRNMSARTTAILENREIIAVDQDPLGEQATLKTEPTLTTQVWTKRLAARDTYAVALLNRGDAPADIGVEWLHQLGFYARARVRDLWRHKDLGTYQHFYVVVVAPHDAVILKVTRLR